MKKYKDKGWAKIKKDKLTAAQVRALDYRGTAALCDVPVAANGDTPTDFFYEHLRRDLANDVEAAEKAAKKQKAKDALVAAVATNPAFAGMSVREDAEGNLEIV